MPQVSVVEHWRLHEPKALIPEIKTLPPFCINLEILKNGKEARERNRKLTDSIDIEEILDFVRLYGCQVAVYSPIPCISNHDVQFGHIMIGLQLRYCIMRIGVREGVNLDSNQAARIMFRELCKGA